MIKVTPPVQGMVIEALHIRQILEHLQETTLLCMCNCNYTSCPCNCNHCICNCNWCTCNCNWGSCYHTSEYSKKLLEEEN